jgi:hypothetical protein
LAKQPENGYNVFENALSKKAGVFMDEKKEQISLYQYLLKLVTGNKQWWLTPMLIVIILAILVILYLIRYKPTDFIYSLF